MTDPVQRQLFSELSQLMPLLNRQTVRGCHLEGRNAVFRLAGHDEYVELYPIDDSCEFADIRTPDPGPIAKLVVCPGTPTWLGPTLRAEFRDTGDHDVFVLTVGYQTGKIPTGKLFEIRT